MFTENLINEFKSMLRGENPVWFAYRKVNGDLRVALGTTNPEEIGEDDLPTGSDKPTSDSVVRYFDVMSDGWRSFRNENLVWVNELAGDNMTIEEKQQIDEYLENIQ